MIAVRAILAIAIMIVGGVIIARMLPLGIGQTYSGIILGLAMIALGAFRLHQLLHYVRSQR